MVLGEFGGECGERLSKGTNKTLISNIVRCENATFHMFSLFFEEKTLILRMFRSFSLETIDFTLKQLPLIVYLRIVWEPWDCL